MLHFKAVATTRFQRWADVGLVIFGIFGMVYTTTLTALSWAQGSGGIKQPSFCDT